MLHRCMPSGRCCPKLAELGQEFKGLSLGQPWAGGSDGYDNPFLKAHLPDHLMQSLGLSEDDLAPGASPPEGEEGDEWDCDGVDAEEWTEDLLRDEQESAQGQAPAGPDAPSPSRPSGPGRPASLAPARRAGARPPGGGAARSRSLEPRRVGAGLPIGGAAQLAQVGASPLQSSPGASSLSLAATPDAHTPLRALGGGASGSRAAGASPSSAGEQPGATVRRELFKEMSPSVVSGAEEGVVLQPRRFPHVHDGVALAAKRHFAGDGQERSFAQSLREAESCQSAVGAAAIANIQRCVQQADRVPEQQRPNSDKWAQRLREFKPEKGQSR